MFPIIFPYFYTEWLIFFYRKIVNSKKKKKTEKMMDDQAHLQENDDLPLWQAPAIKKELPFLVQNVL